MSEWKDCILSDIIIFKNGKKKPSNEGMYPVYGGNGILGYVDDYNLKHGIAIGRVGVYCGSVFYSSKECWISDNAIQATNKDSSDLIYDYYLLKSLKLNERRIGTSQPLLTQEILNRIEIKCPPLHTQRKIASVLSDIDNKISLNTAINENLEQQAQAIFKSWFVDFEPFGGVMPADWTECELDSICSLIIKGITPKYAEQTDQLVINQKCVRNHQIDLSLARYHVPKKINEKWLRYGDIIINSTGTGTLGRAAQVLFEPNNLTVDSHVTIIRPTKAIYQHYLGFWATSHEHDFEMLQTGSTGQTDLPRERLKQMQVILPSDNVLGRFMELVKPICDIRMKNQLENERLSTLRDTLLPKLMSEEIDVSKVKIHAK
ncbi:MAG: restriction endonuclease subunit S [Clostridium sp.]|nr:restriction endonuclease subunit S [Clostridium sp.]